MHDPSHVLLRRALRVAVTLPIAYVFVIYALDLPNGAAYTAFGTFALLAMSDFGGPTKDRVLAYIFTGVAGLVAISIGTLAAVNPWLAIGTSLVVVTGVAFAGVLRGYVAAAVPTVLLPFVIAVTADPAVDQLPARLIGFVIATAFALVAALVLWPVHARSVLRLRVSEVLDASANTVTALWPQAAPADAPQSSFVDLNTRLRELTDANVHLQQAYYGTVLRPGPATARDRALMLLIDEMNRLRMALRWRPDADELKLPADLKLAQITAKTLRDSAKALGHGGPPPSAAGVDEAREEHRQVIEAWASDELKVGHADRVQEVLEAGFHLRVIAITAEISARYTRVATGSALEAKAITSFGEELPDLSRREALRIIRSQLSFRSPWLRNALKMGFALTIAVAVVVLTRAYLSGYNWSSGVTEHGFWVVLGALTALRSDALGTARTAIQVIAGTIGGFVVGSLLIILLSYIGNEQVILWILLPIVTFLAGYTPGAISLMVGQGSFTVFVIVFYALITGLHLQTGELRVLDVAIGLSISLIISAIMWPRGVVARVNATLAEATRKSSAYLVAAYDRLVLGEVAATDAHTAALQAGLAVRTANETFDLAITQGGPAAVNAHIWSCVANAASQVVEVSNFVIFVSRVGRVPIACPEAGDLLLSSAHHVQARLNAAVERVSTKGSPDTDVRTEGVLASDSSRIAPPEDPNTDPFPHLKLCVDSCLRDWQFRDPPAGGNFGRSAIALMWAQDWLIHIDWMAHRVQQLGDVQAEQQLETASG